MSKNILLQPYQLTHDLRLKNRVIMAPLTRTMCTEDHIPTAKMIDYYAKRANAGLIISEATVIREDAVGYPRVPGIYNKEQINCWHAITDAVHVNQGVIFQQIWHVGRVSHPYYLNGNLPISCSETFMKGRVHRASNLYYGKSRELSCAEIQDLIDCYAQAAENAVTAGFDGIEIHAANGYLIDQFLHYDTNKRQDDYGQLPQNMARFCLDIVKACGERIGYHRVAIRLSPGGYMNEISGHVADALVFKYLLSQLNSYPIAYVHTGNFNDKVTFLECENMHMTQFIRKYYQGKLIACGQYDFDEATHAVAANAFDLIAFGRPFIANPDLIEHFMSGTKPRQYDVAMLNDLI